MSMAVPAMQLYSLAFLIRWLPFAVQSFMTAVNQPGYAAALSVSIAIVLPLALIVLLWPLGLTGIWLNFPVTYLLAALLALYLLLRFKKQA